jgi:hypothetical protein
MKSAKKIKYKPPFNPMEVIDNLASLKPIHRSREERNTQQNPTTNLPLFIVFSQGSNKVNQRANHAEKQSRQSQIGRLKGKIMVKLVS